MSSKPARGVSIRHSGTVPVSCLGSKGSPVRRSPYGRSIGRSGSRPHPIGLERAVTQASWVLPSAGARTLFSRHPSRRSGCPLQRLAVSEVFVIFVVTAVATADFAEVRHELDAFEPFDHFEAVL